MAGNIKGITIEFRGETTKLDKAIKDIEKNTRSLDKELKAVDKALKFNPTNVELWRQKQQLLTEKVKDTKDKLELLKQAQAKMDTSGVDKNSAEYRNLQREIIETESKAKTFEKQLREIGNVNLKAASEQIKQVGTQLTNAGQALAPLSKAAAAVVGGLAASAVAAGKSADDLNTLSKVTGIGTDKLQMYKAAADLVDVSVETIAKSQQKLKKNMAAASSGTGSMAASFKKLGVNVTDASGQLRDSDSVFTDVIAALGNMENETERDALAMEIFGKSASELNPLIEDAGATYQQVAETFEKYNLSPISQESLDKANEFNNQLDTLKMLGSTALQTLGAKVAEILLPALEKVVDWGGKIVSWLANLDPAVVTTIGIIAGVVAAIAPLLMLLGKIAMAISSITALAGTLGISLGALAGPVLIVIGVIAALIAIGVLLYKNWDTIKQKAIDLWGTVQAKFNAIKQKVVDTWNAIKQKTAELKENIASKWASLKENTATAWSNIREKMTSAVESAKERIGGIIDRIRGFFPINIGNILSNVKLPHFSLTGKFSLNPPSVPHLNVDWYDKGGIFDSPTVIGVGEKRPEFVGALDDLRSIVREESGGQITINVYPSAGMDETALAAKIEQKLVQLQKRRDRAYGTI